MPLDDYDYERRYKSWQQTQSRRSGQSLAQNVHIMEQMENRYHSDAVRMVMDEYFRKNRYHDGISSMRQEDWERIETRLQSMGNARKPRLYDPPESTDLPPPQTYKGNRTMRKNHVISLLQKEFTTVGVKFDDHQGSGQYTYKARLADQLEVGNKVLVEVDSKGDKGERAFKICTVTRVDEKPNIDTDASFDYKWIVQKVDTAAYDHIVKQEIEFSEQLTNLEREKQRQKVFEDFQNVLPAGTSVQALYDQSTKTESKTE